MMQVEDKIEQWKTKLIDLSKRNHLLYFKASPKGSVKLTEPSIESIYDRLANKGKGMSFPWRDNNFEEEDFSENTTQPQSQFSPKRRDQLKLFSKNQSQTPLFSEPQVKAPTQPVRKEHSPLGQNEIATNLTDKKLNEILYKLRLRANTAFTEQGINILFVAFGLLKWKETAYSTDEYLSPIVLIPVELVRENITKPYELRPIDEDMVINPALIHKMKHDFGLELPTEESFPDENSHPPNLSDIFSKFEEAIKEQKNWAVLMEDVHLGLFSFLKLIMYKDLEKNAEKIKNHPIVKGLGGDFSAISSDLPILPGIEEFDSKISPEETFQVLDADSSQQEAIIAAKKGVSFILQGPPGTGKSQTITNIIAECLSEGEKVLFVSEKMAALEVVYERLKKCGIAEFCLEAHSHKASKEKIIRELGQTLQSPQSAGSSNQSKFDFDKLKNLRERLNKYVLAIHTPHGQLKWTPFEVHGKLAGLGKIPDLRFEIRNIKEIKPGDLREIDELLDRLSGCSNVIQQYPNHPWENCKLENCSLKIKEEILTNLGRFCGEISQLESVVSELAHICGFHAHNIAEIEKLHAVAELLADIPLPPLISIWFRGLKSDDLKRLPAIVKLKQNIHIAKNNCKRLREEERVLSEKYTAEIFALDLEGMYNRFSSARYDSLWRFFYAEYRRDIKSLQKIKKKHCHISPFEDLEKAKSVKEKRQWLSAREAQYTKWFGGYFNGVDTNWVEIENALAWVEKLFGLFNPHLPPDTLVSAISCCGNGISEVNKFLPELKNLLDNIYKGIEYLETIFNNGYVQSVKGQNLQAIQDWLKHCLDHINDLEEWTDFYCTSILFRQKGLSPFIEVVLAQKPDPHDLKRCFYKRFYKLWLDEVYFQDTALREFKGDFHNRLINEFRNLDRQQLDAAKGRIRGLLLGWLPTSGFISNPSGERGILLHEYGKKKRHKPIRRLFKEIPNLLLTIKPCLLMSPLSVSQFLDPELIKFDVVIFDEASQICTEDAIGSIFRGNQLIVVGDKKQLPPTRFFAAAGTEEFEDDDKEYDAFESVLDECGPILSSKRLLWHYRSRHEHLITFSNRHFYDGKLITFPANLNEEECGVKFEHVPNGIYDRSGSRCNSAEARIVADLIFQHFKRHGTKKSLGVVAFSEAQQEAILRELELRRKEDPQYEVFFNDKSSEPFFVKNLENVQGDERDFIFFSVGYGRDAIGKMTVNFGPLNRDGGERRLNVAISRARYHVKLISSIQPTDIDLTHTQSKGVRLLRNYMEFAINGPNAIDAAISVDLDAECESPFEQAVHDALIAQGMTIHKQVGCSGYRLDLAVVDSHCHGKYVLGIECDGAAYHSSKTARDRDRLRQQVLEDLGWRIHRVWSPDWIRDRNKEISRILAVFNDASNGYSAKEDNSGESSFFEEKTKNDDSSELEGVLQESEQADGQNNGNSHLGTEPYIPTMVTIMGTPEDFYKMHQDRIAEVLVNVVTCEGPVHHLAACRRVAQFWGMNKAGSEIQRIVSKATSKAIYNKKIKGNGKFLWPVGVEKVPVRVSTPDGEIRKIEEIAPEEIGEAACLCLKENFSLAYEDLITQTARLLGYSRTGQNVNQFVREGIELLIKQGRVEHNIENRSLKIK